jgi:hypothetical protein
MTYPQHLQIISMTDDQGLLTTLTKRKEYTTPYPNTSLKSYWDLIEEIYTTSRVIRTPTHHMTNYLSQHSRLLRDRYGVVGGLAKN